jgi:hypothetical protein
VHAIQISTYMNEFHLFMRIRHDSFVGASECVRVQWWRERTRLYSLERDTLVTPLVELDLIGSEMHWL